MPSTLWPPVRMPVFTCEFVAPRDLQSADRNFRDHYLDTKLNWKTFDDTTLDFAQGIGGNF